MSVGDNTIAAYAAELMDLEDAVDAAQGDKKFFFENAREAHGKDFAKSLKLAVKIARTEPEKLQEAEAVEAEAERFLGIIRKGLVARGARTREIIEEIQPETAAQTGHSASVAPSSLTEREAVESSGPVLMQEPHDEAEGQGGVGEHGSEEGSQSLLPNGRVENTPDGPAVTVAVPIPAKRITFNDKPHPDCLDTERCGGLSNLGLCQRCKEAAA